MNHRFAVALVAAMAMFASAVQAENKNSEQVFVTSSGTYRIISSLGDFSTDPSGTGSGGFRCDMIQTPDSLWHPLFPLNQPFHIQNILDKDGQTYILAHKGVYAYDGESREFREVFSLPGEMVLGHTTVMDRFYEISKSFMPSDFGGLLTYSDGAWNLISFEENRLDTEKPSVGWVERWKPVYASFVLTTSNGFEIFFNPVGNSFVTLWRTSPSGEEDSAH